MAPLDTTNDTVKILSQLAPLIPVAGSVLGPILNVAQQILEKAKVCTDCRGSLRCNLMGLYQKLSDSKRDLRSLANRSGKLAIELKINPDAPTTDVISLGLQR